jgi:glycerol-1-phosphate dehydrogenase [NAD(P)+]
MLPHQSVSAISRALQAARDTRRLELGPGALNRVPAAFQKLFPGKSAQVVADPTTFAVAGARVLEALRAAGVPCREPFIYAHPDLCAEQQHVLALETALTGDGAIPIAVGSGTINDLTKLAAHRTGRHYLTVATAASMDGYTAFGASITEQGSKRTFPCPAPVALIADPDILAAAPRELNAAGYADLLAKTTAGADWLLADALGVERIYPEAWQTVQGGLRAALSHPDGVPQRNPSVLRQLTEGLVLSGLAMQLAQSSRPASGAEHQFSHLWDMQHHTCNRRIPWHGFKVGLGTLAMTALYEHLLTLPLHNLDVDFCCAHWPALTSLPDTVRAVFGESDLARVALEETRAKWIDVDALRSQLETLRRLWPELKPRLQQQLLPSRRVRAMLAAAGAPIDPDQIGFSRAQLRPCFWLAYLLRRRFTALDLAVRCGLLDSCLEGIFGCDGLWPLTAQKSGG